MANELLNTKTLTMKSISFLPLILAASAVAPLTAQNVTTQSVTPPTGGNAGGLKLVWEDVSPPTLATTAPMSIDAQDGGVGNLIVGTAFQGICRSSNQGLTWSNNYWDFYIDEFSPSWWVNDVAFRAGTPNEALAITMHGTYWSDSSGNFWYAHGYPRPEGSFDVETSPDGLHAAAADQNGRVWIYEWATKSWIRNVQISGASIALNVDFDINGVLYVASDSDPEVWTSADLGLTWNKCGRYLPSRATEMICDPEIDGRAHTVCAGDLYVTETGPITGSWALTGDGLPNGILDLIHHPNQPNVMFAGTTYEGVYVSRDRGNTWKSLGTTGMSHLAVVNLAISADDPTWLYAAAHSNSSATGAVYRLKIQ